jgi:signal peptidase I
MSAPGGFDPRSLTKWVRYAVYAVVAVCLWQFLGNFSFVRIEEGDNSIIGVTGRHKLVVRKYTDDYGEPERGQIVVFAMETTEGRAIRRVGRVAGLPGDCVTAAKEFIEINGEATLFPAAEARRIEGIVPEGTLLILNDEPRSLCADSRRLGFIPRAVVFGRFLCEAPF